ncbi:L-lysine exporter family protein LysE/ArgO [Nocardiopsis terrae]|uniref:L-lysine exporter family protein LysE/ArgO n=1 Tax=Nocardiopsis terrae TaxID=372655 RepID=A0ABR9HDQ9_9ACTN|nr:LysE/ArgO family amino acid transporter [Nocardiopsis terrae]MBE1457164.1 L-lysine exporter family protein LysE/ArgO [Nocardiopsis terrae]
MNETLLPALTGMGTGLALIVAIGAQNAYLLRLGIEGRSDTVLAVVLLCAVSDALLITAGVVGIGGLVQALPTTMVVIRLLGAGFLVVYGLLAAWRALRPGRAEALVPTESVPAGDVPGTEPGPRSESGSTESGSAVRAATRERTSARKRTGTRAALVTAFALTWLNPHVYLDTVLFLGSVANQQAGDARWWWAAGAVTGSFVWFFSLGFGARLLRPVFARPGAWRVLDGAIAVLMLTLGVRLALGA